MFVPQTKEIIKLAAMTSDENAVLLESAYGMVENASSYEML